MLIKVLVVFLFFVYFLVCFVVIFVFDIILILEIDFFILVVVCILIIGINNKNIVKVSKNIVNFLLVFKIVFFLFYLIL